MFNVDMTRVREKIFFLITTRSTGQVVSIRQPRQRSVDWKNTFPSLRFRKFFFFFCILFIYFLFTGIVQTTYRSKHTNITKFTTTTLITKKKKKKKIE